VANGKRRLGRIDHADRFVSTQTCRMLQASKSPPREEE
jgi:hypothetical protein